MYIYNTSHTGTQKREPEIYFTYSAVVAQDKLLVLEDIFSW